MVCETCGEPMMVLSGRAVCESCGSAGDEPKPRRTRSATPAPRRPLLWPRPTRRVRVGGGDSWGIVCWEGRDETA